MKKIIKRFGIIFIGLSITLLLTVCDDLNRLTEIILDGSLSINNTSPKVGDTLTASYQGGNGTGIPTWQWISGEEVIPESNSNEYIVKTQDIGRILTVSLSFSDQSGNLRASTEAVASNSQAPVPEDYYINNLVQTVGSVIPVTIIPKEGKSSGAVTVFYNDSTDLPYAVGTYTITFNVEEADGWNSAYGLNGGILTINMQNQTPNSGDYIFSNLNQMSNQISNVGITARDGRSPGAITIFYNGSTSLPTHEGRFWVTFNVEAAPGWNEANGLIVGYLVIIDPTPVAGDFDISNLTQMTSNISHVRITPKPGKSPGTIIIFYNGSEALPTTAGTYTVTFRVMSTNGWTASNNNMPAGTLTIIESMPMTRISAGSFTMGSPASEPERSDNEGPQWEVIISNDFWMGTFEVTQYLYLAIMGNNPSIYSTNPFPGESNLRQPVENVGWYDTLVFANRLSIMEGLTPAYRINGSTNPNDWGAIPYNINVVWDAVEIVDGSTGYRLPTEAQWEYASRAGTTTAYSNGINNWDNQTALDQIGWFNFNSGNRPREVGRKQANPWGLYDMHGNVFEWCWDRYGLYPIPDPVKGPFCLIDPMGPPSGQTRVIRGGAFPSTTIVARSASRLEAHYGGGGSLSSIGFRLVRPAE